MSELPRCSSLSSTCHLNQLPATCPCFRLCVSLALTHAKHRFMLVSHNYPIMSFLLNGLNIFVIFCISWDIGSSQMLYWQLLLCMQYWFLTDVVLTAVTGYEILVPHRCCTDSCYCVWDTGSWQMLYWQLLRCITLYELIFDFMK